MIWNVQNLHMYVDYVTIMLGRFNHL